MKISGFVIEAPNGRLYGLFATAEDAVKWMNETGSNIAGALNVRVVYDADALAKKVN